MLNTSDLIKKLNNNFNGSLVLAEDGETIIVLKDDVVKLLGKLKDEFKFNFLVDETAVDFEDRFEIVYHLMAMTEYSMIRVKTVLPKNKPEVASIVSLWSSAEVMERETYDLMGILFEGHKNLKRILCKDDFVGHPLRKDFIIKTGGMTQ
jgi:NADH-quinone oxidoreductase subunit C